RAPQLRHAPGRGDEIDRREALILECNFEGPEGKAARVLLPVEAFLLEDEFGNAVLQEGKSRVVGTSDKTENLHSLFPRRLVDGRFFDRVQCSLHELIGVEYPVTHRLDD